MHKYFTVNILNLLFVILFISNGANLFSQSTEQPNIIFIILDDLNDYVEDYDGQPQVETPNIHAIADNGTTFTKAYCTSPQCGPSRMSMLTGKDADYTKIYTNTEIICNDFRENFTEENNNAEVFTLPEYLKDSAGYFTYGINKLFHCHEDYPDYDSLNADACNRNFSWNKLVTFPGGENHDVSLAGQEIDNGVSGLNHAAIDNSWENKMFDYVAVDSAIYFLNAYTTDNSIACGKPLFLAVGLRRPHNPLFIPEKYFDENYFPDFYETPFNKPYNDPYNAFPYNGVIMPPQPDTMWNDFYHLPENGVAQSIALETNVHENLMQSAQGYWSDLPEIDPTFSNAERLFIIQESTRANAVLAYLAAIKFVDAQVGRLYDYLQTHPEFLNNTIIIIASDNGYSLGEKQHWRKGSLWETDIRIPLIIADMRNPNQQLCSKTVSLLDIYPTIIEMLELNEPVFSDGSKYLDGKSLLPLLNNSERSWSHPILVSTKNKPMSEGNCFPQYTVRDERFHYIKYKSNNSVYGITTCDEINNILEEEFYTLGKNYNIDPFEWDNRINDETYQPVIKYLQQWLPDSVMYMQNAFETKIENDITKCFVEKTDTLHLTAEVFDTSGNIVTDFDGYTLQWTNNLTSDVFYGDEIDFPVNNLSDALYDGQTRIFFYLNLYDAATKNIGFDMQYYFINPLNQPGVTFTTEMINGETTVTINDYTITGTYNNTWWDFGDGTIVHDLIPAPHIYNEAGDYTVTNYVQYGNDTSCINTYTASVYAILINPEDYPVYLFPNPAQQYLTIALDKYDAEVKTEIFDVLGKKYLQFETDSTQLIQDAFTIDVSALHNGQYIIKCTTGNNIFNAKCIIMR
ncbi:MAG: sulfatase-like hydrolase/transferase [Fimbriimonadaceae bacterium]|nr:sulfatase-like hydrolase/transferase [Chitinophagales bacterium]